MCIRDRHGRASEGKFGTLKTVERAVCNRYKRGETKEMCIRDRPLGTALIIAAFAILHFGDLVSFDLGGNGRALGVLLDDAVRIVAKDLIDTNYAEEHVVSMLLFVIVLAAGVAVHRGASDQRSAFRAAHPYLRGSTDAEALAWGRRSGRRLVLAAAVLALGGIVLHLSLIHILLLREPYFAKIALQFKEGAPAKELYIGSAGISDENYRRLVVDWRSPVAEVYYNQTMGPTSYVADGRTIHVDLQLRRQFEIEEDRLITYFDSDVAIEDKLLLVSLSRGRSAHMQAITATIQREPVSYTHLDVYKRQRLSRWIT